MMESLPPLNMSCIIALQKLVRNELNILSKDQLFSFKKSKDATWVHLNWDAAAKWLNLIEGILDDDSLASICRVTSKVYIKNHSLLRQAATKGRETLRRLLTEDENQVLRTGRLLEQVPDLDVITWWDEFRMEKRMGTHISNVEQGRLAEFWQMEVETSITETFGTDYHPVWESLNGDEYGYDIRTFRKDASGTPTSLLIEVKSFNSPTQPTIFISRNEWNVALQKRESYLFSIWCIENKYNFPLTVDEAQQYVPLDRDRGMWQNVKVDVTHLFRPNGIHINSAMPDGL